MHILKFTQGGGEPPDTYYLEEKIGFSEAMLVKVDMFVSLEESIGLKAIQAGVSDVIIDETIGFNQDYILDTLFTERIGFDDSLIQQNLVEKFESIGLGVQENIQKVISITIEENIGFVDGGTEWLDTEFDMNMTWRTRTKSHPTYGMGGTSYGDVVSYGDGDADDLVSFKVKCYKNYVDDIDDNLVRTEIITIADTGDPDADALFTYTIAMNKADNGTVFNWDMVFMIYSVDINSIESPVQISNFELFNKNILT